MFYANTDIIAEYFRILREDGLETLLTALEPARTHFVRGLIPQLEALRGQKDVVLVLGMCPIEGRLIDPDRPSSKTEAVVAGMKLGGRVKVLFGDMRKDCRRISPDGKNSSRCMQISPVESRDLVAMTALEIEIAEKHFDISFRSVLTFSECWRQAEG